MGPVLGYKYHKQCFRCHTCDRLLDFRNYRTNLVDLTDRQIYCVSHSPRNGKYTENFYQTLPKSPRTPTQFNFHKSSDYLNSLSRVESSGFNANNNGSIRNSNTLGGQPNKNRSSSSSFQELGWKTFVDHDDNYPTIINYDEFGNNNNYSSIRSDKIKENSSSSSIENKIVSVLSNSEASSSSVSSSTFHKEEANSHLLNELKNRQISTNGGRVSPITSTLTRTNEYNHHYEYSSNYHGFSTGYVNQQSFDGSHIEFNNTPSNIPKSPSSPFSGNYEFFIIIYLCITLLNNTPTG